MKSNFWQSGTISERFDCLAVVGSGNIGTIYKARDKILDKMVAIKVLKSNLTAEQTIRFQKEAKLAGKLHHESIATVYNFGVSGTHPYLVMEFVEGKSLAETILERGQLSLPEALPLFIQIAEALKHSHANGVLHRDLKPSNVILTANNRIKVVDFGIARLKDKDERLTPTRHTVGSPLYMAPEQAEGASVDERSDIYSMGCLMYEVLSGQRAFEGETIMETLLLHKTKEPASIAGHIRGATEDSAHVVDAFVLKCLAKDPADRYRSFSELLEDLDRLSDFLDELDEQNQRSRNEYQESGHRPLPVNTIKVKNLPDASGSAIRFSIPFVLLSVLVLIAWLALSNSKPEKGTGITTEENDLTPRDRGGTGSAKRTSPQAQNASNENDAKLWTKYFRQTQEKSIIAIAPKDVTDENLAVLKTFKAIESLQLDDSEVTGEGFASVPNLSITRLSVSGCPISDKGLQQIAKIKGLIQLSLTRISSLNDFSLSCLAANQTLGDLAISGEKFTENAFQVLEKNPHIYQVTPISMTVSDRGAKHLLCKSNLVFIACNISDKALITLASRPQPFQLLIIGNMPLTIRQVNLVKRVPASDLYLLNVILTRPAFRNLAGLKNLKKLSLMDVNFSRAEIKSLQATLPNLTDKITTKRSPKVPSGTRRFPKLTEMKDIFIQDVLDNKFPMDSL